MNMDFSFDDLLLEDLFQARHKGTRKMAVLEQDPIALFNAIHY